MATCPLMRLHRLVLLAAWVSHLCADEGTALCGDQGGRLCTKWQASIREARLSNSNKGVSPPRPITAGSTKQLLYCRIGIGYHLQILPNGTVGGVHEHTEYSWLNVFAMKQGVVGVQGLKSGLYLCMNKDGIPHGLSRFTTDCLFRESLEENHYTTYSSISYPGFYLALFPRGGARRGSSVSKQQLGTHFLPRRIQCKEPPQKTHKQRTAPTDFTVDPSSFSRGSIYASQQWRGGIFVNSSGSISPCPTPTTSTEPSLK